MSRYIPTTEKDGSACGVGVEFNLREEPTHELLQRTLDQTVCNTHRASATPGSDSEPVGDGVGISTDIPLELFQDWAHTKKVTLKKGAFGVGQFFLPQDPNFHIQGMKVDDYVEKLLSEYPGITFAGWRDVELDYKASGISKDAIDKQPRIRQAVFTFDDSVMPEKYEHTCRAVLKKIHQEFAEFNKSHALDRNRLHVASLSSENIVYKAMATPAQFVKLYKDFASNLFKVFRAVYHVRMATNTAPEWSRAQPFDVAHNGEINTDGANRQDDIEHATLQDGVRSIADTGSDTARLGARVNDRVHFENMPLSEALYMTVMPSMKDPRFSERVKAMLRYRISERKPSTGPAHVCFMDKNEIGAMLDPSGLRPSRHVVTVDKDGNLAGFYIGSENSYSEAELKKRGEYIVTEGQLSAGEMILLRKNPEARYGFDILRTEQILEELADPTKNGGTDFEALVKDRIIELTAPAFDQYTSLNDPKVQEKRKTALWDQEIIDRILIPMAAEGKMPTAAMGDDAQRSAQFTGLPQHMARYFKQLFAQITNPPLDALREKEKMSLDIVIGSNTRLYKERERLGIKLLDDKIIPLSSPILRPGELSQIQKKLNTHTIDITYEEGANFEQTYQNYLAAIERCKQEAEQAVKDGYTAIIVSDRNMSENRLALPDLRIGAAIKSHLRKHNLSLNASLILDSAQPKDPHHIAMAGAMGFDAVNAYMIPEVLHETYGKNLPAWKGKTEAQILEQWYYAADNEIRKIMGKFGVNNACNLFGGSNLCEVEGIDFTDPELAKDFNPAPYSPVAGVNDKDICNDMAWAHKVAYGHSADLAHLGQYSLRPDSIPHRWGPEFISFVNNYFAAHEAKREPALQAIYQALDSQMGDNIAALQTRVNQAIKPDNQQYTRAEYAELQRLRKELTAAKADLEAQKAEARRFLHLNKAEIDAHTPSEAYLALAQAVENLFKDTPIALRDNLKLKTDSGKSPVPLDQFKDSVTDVLERMRSGAMSFGALTGAAWSAIHEGLNEIGSGANAGEGGQPLKNAGTSKGGRDVQVASARFGLSPELLTAVSKNDGWVQIKVVQGAKPGEGGELPGGKVTINIAGLRGALPGVNLPSPAPMHDIYSIEDLQNLIYSLKSFGVNVDVKIGATQGCDTVAIGASKAGANKITLSGHEGGTGAAGIGSASNTGQDWALMLPSVVNGLKDSRLRDCTKVVVEGGISDDTDMMLALALGADEIGMGTMSMIANKCIMARVCQAKGVNQDQLDELRNHYYGKHGSYPETDMDNPTYTKFLKENWGQFCPTGVTNSEALFISEPWRIQQYYLDVAASLRQKLAGLGWHSIEEFKNAPIKEKIEAIETIKDRFGKYDFSSIFTQVENKETPDSYIDERNRNPRGDDEFLGTLEAHLASGNETPLVVENIQLTNESRSFGTKLSSLVCEHVWNGRDAAAMDLWPDRRVAGKTDVVKVKTYGNAGQCYGAYLAGVHLEHVGVLHDNVGQSGAGGIISCRRENLGLQEIPERIAEVRKEFGFTEPNQIAGNCVGYGNYGTEMYLAGKIGQRAFVTAKGGVLVCQGAGDFLGQFMSGGTIINYSSVYGAGVGNGCVGGVIFQYDPKNRFEKTADMASLRLMNSKEVEAGHVLLKKYLEAQVKHTGCTEAQRILDNFEQEKHHFKAAVSKQFDRFQTLQTMQELHRSLNLRPGELSRGEEAVMDKIETDIAKHVRVKANEESIRIRDTKEESDRTPRQLKDERRESRKINKQWGRAIEKAEKAATQRSI